ncbi:MAG: glycoside hydrolase family 3 protein, partial [bacterium]|nr:glycoside hydrolase family 3 protein [bacterium]
MKKNVKLLIVFILLILLITAVIIFKKNNNKVKLENNVEKKGDRVFVEEESLDKKINNKLKTMSIEEKISQMLIINYENDEIDSNMINFLNTNSLGGIILMKNNITTFDKTKKLVSDFKSNSSIPLIISIEQEGGSVQRLQYLTDVSPTYIPFMYDLGLTSDDALAYEVGKVIGNELKTIGVNVVYAPVVDIYSNPFNTVIGKRSFSSNSNIVSHMANAVASGLEDIGVIPTYKHFPGHGDTDVDSHYNLPVINKTYDELNNLELTTFKSAIENDAKIIMVGHIALPKITNDLTPASLSKKIVTDILKHGLGYNGLVVTDALNMGGVTNKYSDCQIYTEAINAGVDLLLMPNNYIDAIECVKTNIKEDRINESVKKILMFKYTYLNDYKYNDKEILGSEENKKII